MILTTQKPLEEIMKYLEPYNNVLVVGCGTCATQVQTGGEKEVKEMAEKLQGKWFTETMMIEAPCDERIARKDWRKIRKKAEDLDAILVMACGAGVQTLSDISHLPCFPGLDTHFLGKVERIGLYYERCRACGSCVLGETAGICPVTRCAKQLMNGPCGGMYDGKCEVKGYVRDCAWYLIWKRLKDQGRLEFFRKVREPREFGLEAYPRGIDAIPDHMVMRREKGPLLGPDENEEIIVRAVNEVARARSSS
jgi:hypothetical protein